MTSKKTTSNKRKKGGRPQSDKRGKVMSEPKAPIPAKHVKIRTEQLDSAKIAVHCTRCDVSMFLEQGPAFSAIEAALHFVGDHSRCKKEE